MPDSEKKLGPEHATTPVGQYYLLDKIAQGGMAEIFKGLAYDLHGIKRTVVIKKILPEIAADQEFINMLINEAKIAVMLSHGNIAQIYDLGKVGGDYFMVMEYVDGKSLSQILKRSLKHGHLLPVEYACYFVSEVANGLNYMHRRSDDQGKNLGIIHRDISPQNVIVSYSGTVKIIDFGIAKAAVQMNITESGILKGKFAYMSPEQAKGEHADHRTDIFSLGVILHELLTGRRLFKGASKKETLQNVRRAFVPAPSEKRPGLTPELDKIVMKVLAKDPKNRYLWASEFRDDLLRFIHTNYPDFKPSSVVEFIHELFKEDIAEKEELEEEAKTPFLIIDHTQSAILEEGMEDTGRLKVPPQLKAFMLDEETPIEEIREAGEAPAEEKKKIDIRGFIKRRRRLICGLAAAAAFALIAAFFGTIGKGYIKPFQPKTKLTVDVEPRDAEVAFENILLTGQPPFTIKSIEPGVEYELIVHKEGFISYHEPLSLKPGERKNLKIILQPEPPHYGTLAIDSDPPGATIFLNEKNTNFKTPAKLSALQPGKYHSIGLFLEGYAFWSRDVTLEPDEDKALSAALAPDFGTLEIISTPSGADVIIDGILAGKTPLIKNKLKPGGVTEITVAMPGFISYSEKVRIKPGVTLTLRPRLFRTKEMMVPYFLRNIDKK